MVISCRGQHLHQVADLGIRTQCLGTGHEMNGTLWELASQTLNCEHGGIAGFADAEYDFVLRVLLQAMTAEALVNFRILAFERLQNRDWREGRTNSRIRDGGSSPEKTPSTPQTGQRVGDPGQRSCASYDCQNIVQSVHFRGLDVRKQHTRPAL